MAQALLAYLQEAGAGKLNWTAAARQLQQRLEFLRQHFPQPAESTGSRSDWPAFDDEALLR